MSQAIYCSGLVKRYEGRPPLEAVRGLVNRLGPDQVKKLVDMAGMFS